MIKLDIDSVEIDLLIDSLFLHQVGLQKELKQNGVQPRDYMQNTRYKTLKNLINKITFVNRLEVE